MSNRISLDREAVDRTILIGMDVDRYQTQGVWMARLLERRRSSKPAFLRQMEGSCESEATR